MDTKSLYFGLISLLFASLMISCGGGSGESSSSNINSHSESSSSGSPSSESFPLENFYNVENIYIDGDEVVIQTYDLPDHGSPYYVDAQGNGVTGYEPYSGNNPQFHQNDNRISAKLITFRIPLNPQPATITETTPLGAMGVAVNGVLLFNQYAAGFSPLGPEINSFDQYNGHPTGQHQYHYHIEPLYLTDTLGTDALIGVLLDGYPVYGPVENGVTLTNSDLDEYHGHTGPTKEFPDGIYHYHVTDDAPYMNGDGFYGVPGTVTQN